MSSRGKHIDITQEAFETIDRYLSGDMEQTERDKFEQRLLSDAVLREQVEAYRALFKGVEMGSLKAKLESFHRELPEEGKKKGGRSGKSVFMGTFARYAVAASVIFFILLGSWWIFNSPARHEQLFANHFKPDPGLATVMSSDNDYDFYVGMVDYKREEYQKALEQWAPLLEERPGSDTLNYFMGVAYLAAGQENQAIAHLKEVVENQASPFVQEAGYYLGLSYLKHGRMEEARAAFAKSSDERSKEILKELDN